MPLQNTNVIDLIAQDPANGTVVLGMTEPRPWNGEDLQVFQLQEKINAYLSFALDGEMNEHFPQFRNKPLRLELVCTAEPDARTMQFVKAVQEQIGFQGIEFLVKVNPELAQMAEGGACATGGCGCHGGAEGEAQAHAHHHHAHAEGGCCGGQGHSHDHDHAHGEESGGCCGGHDHSHESGHQHSQHGQHGHNGCGCS